MSVDVGELYRRYGDLVLSRCRMLLGNEADARDAVQNVFLQAHRAKDGFRGDASPSTWLWRIATHTCLNGLRARRRRPEDPVEDMGCYGDALLDPVEVRDLIDRAVDGEDETTKLCVIYHFVDGMTHDETGAMLGLGGAAVRKRIAGFRERAKGRLPAALEVA